MSVYRFLEDAYINNQFYPAGTTASTVDAGGTLPFAWAPTGNVEPMDQAAVNVFAAVGPQNAGLIRTQFSTLPVPLPKTYWQGSSLIAGTIQPIPIPLKIRTFRSGAVTFGPGSYIQGPSEVSGLLQRGVISVWTRLLRPTSFLFINQWLAARPYGTISVTIDPDRAALALNNVDGTNLITASAVNSADDVTDWNHYICSWDVSQLVPSSSSGGIQHQTFGFQVIGTSPNSAGPMNDGKYQVIAGMETAPNGIPGDWSVPGLLHTLIDTTTTKPYSAVTASGETGVGTTVFSATYSDTNETIGVAILDFTGLQIQGIPPYLDPAIIYTINSITSITREGPVPAITYRVNVDASRQIGGPANIVEAQWAINRSGKFPFNQPYDTNQNNSVNAQAMTEVSGSGTTGNLATGFYDRWTIGAPLGTIDVAYCYFGTGVSFFDLTAPGNLDFFVTTGIEAVNLGDQGINVTPLKCIWLHTGDAELAYFNPMFTYNIATGNPWLIIGSFASIKPEPPLAA